MRSPRQLLFDRFYYGLELDIVRFFTNREVRQQMKSVRFDQDFYRAYREQVVPYWKKFGIKPDVNWSKLYYTRTGTVDPRYIPDDVFSRYVVPYFNNRRFARPLCDKNLYHMIFPDVKRPETVFKFIDGCFCEDDLTPILSRADVVSRLERPGRFVFKPTRDSSCGADIAFADGPLSQPEAERFLAQYGNDDYIVQQALVQHPDLAYFNPTSVNTLRLFTLTFHGKAYYLSGVIRIGHPGDTVDNVSRGGYQVDILPDGSLARLAYTHQGGKEEYVEQNEEGKRFGGAVIPCWDKVRQTALDQALKLPHLHLIAWDFSVDRAGDVVLIEFNCINPGQNQETSGPTFGDMTDEVLAEVFADKKLKL